MVSPSPPCQHCAAAPPINPVSLPFTPQQLPDVFSTNTEGEGVPSSTSSISERVRSSTRGVTLGPEALVKGEVFMSGVVQADLPPLCNTTQFSIAPGQDGGVGGSRDEGNMRQINYSGSGSWSGAQHGVGGNYMTVKTSRHRRCCRGSLRPPLAAVSAAPPAGTSRLCPSPGNGSGGRRFSSPSARRSSSPVCRWPPGRSCWGPAWPFRRAPRP